MFLKGTDARGDNFLDLTKTLDISAGGALMASNRSLKPDAVISLTVPAPPIPGHALLPEATPPIQARVRRLRSAGEFYLAAVEFLKPLD